MRITSRRGTIVFFLCLGIGLVALAVALNVGWIILNWREGVLLFFGIIFFALIIAGMIVNTSFLVHEIRRSEQHDSFINAVTHELKTPVASIRLHLETLLRRELPEARKQEFYRLMLSDTDRLTETVEQVLRAGRARDKKAGREKSAVDFRQLVSECMEAARVRHHLPPEALRYEEAPSNGAGICVMGSSEDLHTAVFNVIDNAIKYSGDNVDVRVRLEMRDEERVVLHAGQRKDRIHLMPAQHLDQCPAARHSRHRSLLDLSAAPATEGLILLEREPVGAALSDDLAHGWRREVRGQQAGAPLGMLLDQPCARLAR